MHLGSASQISILSGQLLNCFSKDMDAIDNTLSNIMFTCGLWCGHTCVHVISILYHNLPIEPIWLSGYFSHVHCAVITKCYLNISCQLCHMESTSRSPIFSGFGELLEGIVTTWAFSAENQFMKEFHKK